jgi:hypothetical protein
VAEVESSGRPQNSMILDEARNEKCYFAANAHT